MAILIFNSGSSSLKFRLFDEGRNGNIEQFVKGMVTELGPHARCEWWTGETVQRFGLPLADQRQAAAWALGRVEDFLAKRCPPAQLTAVGHRVAHDGGLLASPVRISDAVLAQIEATAPLAPLHNPMAAEVIRTCRARLGRSVPMVAVFDTAFFHDLPDVAGRYALPAEWTRKYGVRRYGFHGIAHRYMNGRYAAISQAPVDTSRVITVQLGQGCSVAAIRGGVPLDTSMGFTPLEGLVMGMRCGDVDAGALLYLITEAGLSPEQLYRGLYEQAGLLGLSGVTGDVRELLGLEDQGHAGAAKALDTYCYRVRKYLGAYLSVLGGADAIVFGGGVGENAPRIRARMCAGMDWCGLALNESLNAVAIGKEACISAKQSGIAVHVIPVDEEAVIARETLTWLQSDARAPA